jgi:hypothetical protein
MATVAAADITVTVRQTSSKLSRVSLQPYRWKLRLIDRIKQNLLALPTFVATGAVTRLPNAGTKGDGASLP